MAQPPRDSAADTPESERTHPSPSRQSVSSPHTHAPQTPSRLRHSFAPGSPSPEHLTTSVSQERGSHARQWRDTPSPPESPIDIEEEGIYPTRHNEAVTGESLEQTRVRGQIVEEHDHSAATESSRLLHEQNQKKYGSESHPHSDTHGSNPRQRVMRSRHASIFGDYDEQSTGVLTSLRPILGRFNTWMSTTEDYGNGDGGNGKNGTRQRLVESWKTYLPYYVPILKWATQYRLSWLVGDITAAVTMASFYIPMALSYADNLGHVPAINGLYSFVFNPLIYAILGTCPQMVVGPEAPGSLLLGNVVRNSVEKGHAGEDEDYMHARIAGVVTAIAGLTILISGLFRLGFLDNVLSRSFLRGFISAIGVVIFIDQLIPELGLTGLAKELGVDHAPALNKLVFLLGNLNNIHQLNAVVSMSAFVIIMVCRTLKTKLQPRFPAVAYIPDRFIVVVLSAVLTYSFSWDKQGVTILGEVKASGSSAFQVHWPFDLNHIKHIQEALSTAFLIALLGFFESSVAAKALGDGSSKPEEGIQGMSLSPNRELVAMGVANLVGGCFMALPAFGGYGRSKVNKSTGGRTPMSSIILSFITMLCVFFLVPYFYYLPRGVLSAMVSVVAYSLVEEAPHDIRFFIRVRGWSELALMFIIFAATIVYSLPLGIALGIGLSLLRVIRHATKPRIQLLVKVPGTDNQFENAEYLAQMSETWGSDAAATNDADDDVSSRALIVKIPEPLTFANTGDLRARLRRLEFYGAVAAHPALPRIRQEWQNQTIIFDIHGATSIDASGIQILSEVVSSYAERGSSVFFSRVPGGPGGRMMTMFEQAGIVHTCGGGNAFVRSVDEALRLAAAAERNSVGEDATHV